MAKKLKMNMSVDQRIALAIKLLAEGETVSTICNQTGSSVSTYYKWKREGLLVPKVSEEKKVTGRPLGSKNRRTLFVDDLTPEGAAEVLTIFKCFCTGKELPKGTIEKNINPTFVLAAIDRLYPKPLAREQLFSELSKDIDFSQKRLSTLTGLDEAVVEVMNEVKVGNVSMECGNHYICWLKEKREFMLYELDDKMQIIKKSTGKDGKK